MSVYGSRADEPALLGGLRALGAGETSGHITTDEYFTDHNLYKKYIEGTDIPCRIFKDKKTGEIVYRVHFSFGPATSNTLHPGSVLDADEYINGLNAHYLTSSPEMTLINQYKLTVGSPLDLVGITQHQIRLTAQSIIKTTPENAAAVKEFQENIQKALNDFVNSTNASDKDKPLKIYQDKFKQEFEKLHQAIAPSITFDQFAEDFHTIGSIGIEPIETRELNLITAEQQKAGMQGSRIDLRLAKIREIYNVMKHEDYNFILNNCSHKAAAIERAGVSECSNNLIRGVFNHTVGYNELQYFHLFSPEGIAGVAMFVDPALGRHLESPVNVLRNDDALKRNLKKLERNKEKSSVDHLSHHYQKPHGKSKPSPFTSKIEKDQGIKEPSTKRIKP